MGSIPDVLFRGVREFTEYHKEVKHLLTLVNSTLEQINKNKKAIDAETLKSNYREVEQRTPQSPENLKYSHIAPSENFALAGLIDALRRLEATFQSNYQISGRYYSGHQETRIEPIISEFVRGLNEYTLEESISKVSELKNDILKQPNISQ